MYHLRASTNEVEHFKLHSHGDDGRVGVCVCVVCARDANDDQRSSYDPLDPAQTNDNFQNEKWFCALVVRSHGGGHLLFDLDAEVQKPYCQSHAERIHVIDHYFVFEQE